MLTSNFFHFLPIFLSKEICIFKQTLPLCANILEIKLIFKEREGDISRKYIPMKFSKV